MTPVGKEDNARYNPPSKATCTGGIMNVRYSDQIKQPGNGFALLQQATKCLEEVATRSAALATAEWDRTHDEHGRPVYVLKLSDFSGTVTDRFSSHELEQPRRLRWRLRSLWGDLLQVRSHKQLQALTEGSSTSGE